MFIVSLNYKCPLDEVDKHLDAHVDYLKQQYANGNFIASGRKVPRTGGVILCNAKSKNELESIIAKDPFHQEDIAQYDITEFVPNMVAAGFEQLKEQ
jgi:uncharacterized protein YciI